jgi:hypothetical protein
MVIENSSTRSSRLPLPQLLFLSLQENMASSSILLYSSVSRNITELYFSIPKLKKIPGTDECRPLYLSVNRLIYIAVHKLVNQRMYGMPLMKFKNSYPCAYSLPAPPTHSASCHILTLNHCRCHRPSAAATLVPPPALPRVGSPPLIAWLRLCPARCRPGPPPLALPTSAYLRVSPNTASTITQPPRAAFSIKKKRSKRQVQI